MTTNNSDGRRTRWVSRRYLETEGFAASTADSSDLIGRRWHEESKRRYEELAHQWLELAEQRQRCA
jgi:hypothetical protein